MNKSHGYYLPVLDMRDFIEIFFGVLLGLLIFLGASELWQIGAVLNDVFVVLIAVVNFLLLYLMTRFISGRVHKSAVFIESIKFPLKRSMIVYLIGILISAFVMYWLYNAGILELLTEITAVGLFPMYVRVAVFANLFATLFAITIDLSVIE